MCRHVIAAEFVESKIDIFHLPVLHKMINNHTKCSTFSGQTTRIVTSYVYKNLIIKDNNRKRTGFRNMNTIIYANA